MIRPPQNKAAQNRSRLTLTECWSNIPPGSRLQVINQGTRKSACTFSAFPLTSSYFLMEPFPEIPFFNPFVISNSKRQIPPPFTIYTKLLYHFSAQVSTWFCKRFSTTHFESIFKYVKKLIFYKVKFSIFYYHYYLTPFMKIWDLN